LKANVALRFAIILIVLKMAQFGRAADDSLVPLPPGVQAIWELGKAYREITSTRERICLNGLW